MHFLLCNLQVTDFLIKTFSMFTRGHQVHIYFIEMKQLFQISTVISAFMYFSLFCAKKDIDNINGIKVRKKKCYSQKFILNTNNGRVGVDFCMCSDRVTGCDSPRQ